MSSGTCGTGSSSWVWLAEGRGTVGARGHPGNTVVGNHTPFPQTWVPGVGAGPRVWSQETRVREGLHPSGDLGATLRQSLPLRRPSASSDPSSGHVPGLLPPTRPTSWSCVHRPAGCVCACDTETTARAPRRRPSFQVLFNGSLALGVTHSGGRLLQIPTDAASAAPDTHSHTHTHTIDPPAAPQRHGHPRAPIFSCTLVPETSQAVRHVNPRPPQR